MADFSVNHIRHRGARTERLEYRLYFALIFAFALVFALIGHVVAVLRDAQAPAVGPVAKARAEAHQIAPLIFRG
jgi:hypothetical protein